MVGWWAWHTEGGVCVWNRSLGRSLIKGTKSAHTHVLWRQVCVCVCASHGGRRPRRQLSARVLPIMQRGCDPSHITEVVFSPHLLLSRKFLLLSGR